MQWRPRQYRPCVGIQEIILIEIIELDSCLVDCLRVEIDLGE